MQRIESVPDNAALRDFLLGKLSPADSESVKHYLEGHPVDLATLDDLAGSDTFVDHLRDCHRASPAPSPIVSDLITRLERLRITGPADQSKGDNSMQTSALLVNLQEASDAATAASEKADADSLDFLSPPAAPDELGQLGGHRVLRIIGSGGMGMVFEARDAKLDRHVALKVMRSNFAHNASAKERFLREGSLAAAIEDDHIIPIFQIGEDNGVPFLTMPMLRGESLEDRIKKLGTLPVPEVLRIGREIAQGLAAAHEHGLIHRDIKPANIWLEAQAARVGGQTRVKILDFGLARPANPEQEHAAMQLTGSGVIVGTPSYMAPEQARGRQVDARTDLFGLGVVLYRMATGQLPFKGNDTVSQILALTIDTPIHPNLINPNLPEKLSELIMHLLEKDAAQRPASADYVVGELSKIAQEMAIPVDSNKEPKTADPRVGIHASRSGDSKQVALPADAMGLEKPRKRWGLLIAAGFIVFALLIAGTIVVLDIFQSLK